MAEQKQRHQEGRKGTRLNKALAEAGVASRRKADEYIAAGRVKVNGKVVAELGTRVGPDDRITLDGEPIGIQAKRRYILLNKPKDAITTTQDEKGRRTVMDLLNVRERIFPVGRLDRNTTGLLLLTNDGDFAFRLTHPRYGIERVYEAVLDKPISLRDARAIAKGVKIGHDEHAQPCFISVEEKDGSNVVVAIKEGKNREVRRMFEARGYFVRKLNRTSYGGLTIQGVRRGEWRELKPSEVREIKKRLKLG